MTESETQVDGRFQSVAFGWVPTSLTFIRLVLGVSFPFIPARWRLAVLLAAASTEFLDGQLARVLRATSRFGRILDPIADKVFVIAVLLTFLAENVVTPVQLCLVMSRDIVVIVGAAWVALRRGPSALHQMPPSLLGKLATAGQLLLLVTLNLTTQGKQPLIVAVSALSIAAGVDYVRRFRSPVSHL